MMHSARARRSYRGQNADVVLEREDGFIVSTRELETYLAPFRRWPAVERKAMRFVRGRVLRPGVRPGAQALRNVRQAPRKVVTDERIYSPEAAGATRTVTRSSKRPAGGGCNASGRGVPREAAYQGPRTDP